MSHVSASPDQLVSLFPDVPVEFISDVLTVFNVNDSIEFLLNYGHNVDQLERIKNPSYPSRGKAEQDDQTLLMLLGMGFDETQTKRALELFGGDSESAIAFLLEGSSETKDYTEQNMFIEDDSNVDAMDLDMDMPIAEEKSYATPSLRAPSQYMGRSGRRGGRGGRGGYSPHQHPHLHQHHHHHHHHFHFQMFGDMDGGLGIFGGPPPPLPFGSPTPVVNTPIHLDIPKLLSIVNKADSELHIWLSKDHYHTVDPPTINKEEAKLLVDVYTHMIIRFCVEEFRSKYGGSSSDMMVSSLPAGQAVPQYYANVSHSSIFHRKLLSMAGLRNLILFGRDIFLELKTTNFISDPTSYKRGVGLEKMKYYTGNLVDLDTVVLRCSDGSVLKTINEMAKAQNRKTYRDGDDFGQSQEAREIAINAATDMLNEFIKEFKLDTKAANKRKVLLDPKQPIPVAMGNMDRGRYPLWQYINCGTNSFHVNVPIMSDVIGALLRAPLAGAKAYLKCLDNEEQLHNFYEDGIIDSCFNAKWKSLEEFNRQLDSKGSIRQLLEEIQAVNQSIFLALYDADDEEHTKEIAATFELCAGKLARDKDGKVRAITKEDVTKWVNNPNQDI